MFLIRASLLLLVAFVHMTRCDEGAGEDRIGTILSMMADMRTHVGSLTESVKKIYRMEEDTAEHMLKTEDRVSELVQNEGDISKKVEKLVQNEGDMTKKIGNIETQMGHMEQQMAKDVAANTFPYGWKFIGYGNQGDASRQVVKGQTTLQECVTFCTKKRQDSGLAWNGFAWNQVDGQRWCTCNENDVGHTESVTHIHFRIQ